MTQRDQKIVLSLVLVLVGLGFAFVLLQTWFLGPLADYNRQITSLEDEIDGKDRQRQSILFGRKLFEEKKKISLPASRVKASAEYDRYLVTLLQQSGLTDIGVQGPPPAELKAKQPVIPVAPGAAKKPGHTVLTYQVRAKGNMANVATALESLQRTPVMHRVKGLTIGRQDTSAKDANNNKLVMQMTVEAMIVAGVKAEQEPSLKPNTKVELPTSTSPRRYADIAYKNIFTGPIPLPPAPVTAPVEELTAEEELIPEHVRLVSTEPTAQEAWLRTLIFQVPEIRIRSKAGSGYDTFRIMNEDRSKVLVRAVVLRIDQRDVYFQVSEDVLKKHIGDVFRLHIGQTIADAMRRPLSDAELDDLELTDLVHDFSSAKGDAGKKEAAKKGSRPAMKKR